MANALCEHSFLALVTVDHLCYWFSSTYVTNYMYVDTILLLKYLSCYSYRFLATILLHGGNDHFYQCKVNG